MACCYVVAGVIAFFIRGCEVLDIDLKLQYNDSTGSQVDNSGTLADKPCRNGPARDVYTILSISGMTCAACATTIENALIHVTEVEHAVVTLALSDARVWHSALIKREDLLLAVRQVGYDAVIGERAGEQKIKTLRHTQELGELRAALNGLGFCSTLIFILGSVTDYFGNKWTSYYASLSWLQPLFAFCLSVFAACKHGRWIFTNATRAARHRTVNMHTLISLSTVLGLLLPLFNFCRSQTLPQDAKFESTLTVLLVVTAARYIDLLSRREAFTTFTNLYSLLDEISFVRLARLQREVPIDSLRSGDHILIDPYALVPCDGYVIKGASRVNESIITGESMSKSKSVGDLLLAGTRNGSHRLEVVVHEDTNGSFLSQLVRNIENSMSSKIPIQSRIDWITQNFVVGVFIIAVAISARSFVLAYGNGTSLAAQTAMRKMATILSAACPCALGLATPCAVIAGLDVAWKEGILIYQGGETMQHIREVTHMLVDKTGTLTSGALELSVMNAQNAWVHREQDLALVICSVEEAFISTHPVAAAIFKKLLPLCLEPWSRLEKSGRVRQLEEVGGRGISCAMTLSNSCHKVYIGNSQFMADNGIEKSDMLHQVPVSTGTVVYVAIDKRIAATLILQDTIRADAKPTINALKRRGIEISLLTGDNHEEALRVSQDLDIPIAGSCVTPMMKAQHIEKLQLMGHRVAMVGDGMNDGPSLVKADIGIMMAQGRKCLSAGGNVLILDSKLKSVLKLIQISEKTMWQVSANIWWAVAYNVIAIGLAIGSETFLNISISP